MYSTDYEQEPGLNFWPSFTDITLIVILILIVFIFAQIILNTEIFELARIKSKQQEMEQLILSKLSPQHRPSVSFKSEYKTQHITFSNTILFQSGRDELQSEGESVLGIVGGVLRDNTYLFESIQIEGHTDSIPVPRNSAFRSNWDLSSSRATTVVEFFDDLGVDPAQVPISAAGFSEYKPVATTSNPDSLAKNRRIEMIINYSGKQ